MTTQWTVSEDRRRWTSTDWFLLVAVAVVCAGWMLLRFQRNATPIEDASMLLRYAQNFAQGDGLRWNVGDTPVDGATDFLYTVAIGALARLGHISVEAASRVLVLGAQALSVLLIFIAGRVVLGANRWWSAAAVCYLSAGPATKMALGCFGAPFFAFMLLCCWCAALRYATAGANWRRAFAVGAFGLLAGLTRPEGVLITVVLLGGLIMLTSWREARLAILSTLAFFVLLGGPYFLWHWHYFGHPLPNPFYIKGNGHLYFSSVKQAAVNLSVMLAPALPLLPLGWMTKRTSRVANALLLILVCFTAMWVLLNDWNNAFDRFQYAIVPVVLLTLPALVTGLGEEQWRALSNRARRLCILAAALAVAVSMAYFDRAFKYFDTAHGMRDFALRIQPLAAHGDSIVVTEAGALPLFSQWRAYDGLGLNDAYIAHHGGVVTDSYLDQIHPDVVMVHAIGGAPHEEFLTQLQGGVPVKGSIYQNFDELSSWAVRRGYTLEGAMGSSPCNLHLYWVRPGFADKAAFVHALRDYPYRFLDTGDLSYDFRNHLPLQGCQ